MFRISYLPLLSLLLLVGLLAACAGDKEKGQLVPEQSVETLYNQAADQMDRGEYKEAAKIFSEVERQHPYSPWATRAQLQEAFAEYQDLDYDTAIGTLDQFIQLHPGSNDIAYAYYMRALSFYERIVDVRRDQSYAQEALKGMQEVVSRYPDSTYAKDAVLKISLIEDHLAGAEMTVGRWYMGQKLFIAAIGRFHVVIEKYQTTSHVPEALERLVECYLALGITSEAKATAAVLGYNFPGSNWYQDAYNLLVQNHLTPEADPDSWIEHVWKKVF